MLAMLGCDHVYTSTMYNTIVQLSAVSRSVTGTASGSKMIQITRVWLGVGSGILELEHDERKKNKPKL